MYKIAICDNEKDILDHLWKLCEEIMNEKNIPFSLHSFQTAEEFETALDSGDSFDVVILDIELGGKTGLELAAELRNKNNMISIIFVSAYEQYLKYGYGVQPIHFLIKPVEKKKLQEAICADLRLRHTQPQITFKSRSTTIALKVNDITYVEVVNHILYIHSGDNCETTSGCTLTKLEKMLPPDSFCRCHNSFIVNMRHVNKISRTTLLLNTGVTVPIGRKYYEQFQKKFIEYMNS